MSHPSAQPDHFVHDRLPPPEALPTLNYDLPELQIADQVNLVQALFDQAERAGHSDRPLLRGPHRSYTYRDAHTEAAMAKMTATENAQRVIDMALQLHGGRGVEVGSKVESLYRDIRSLRIYEGATEVQQLIIGKALLHTS